MNIYLDIDGTMIHEDLTENYGKSAEGLSEFLIALRPYDTFWLTTHCRDGNPERAREIMKRHVPEELFGDIDRIKPTVWDTLKTEGINWNQDFIWFDNDISDSEHIRFAGAPDTQAFMEVNLRSNPKQLFEIISELSNLKNREARP